MALFGGFGGGTNNGMMDTGPSRMRKGGFKPPMQSPMGRRPPMREMPNMPGGFRGGWGRSSPGQDGTFGGGMRRPPMGGSPPFLPTMPPTEWQQASILSTGGENISTTMPVGRPRPNITPIDGGGGEGMNLWRAYNRMGGGPGSTMGPRLY